MGAVDNIPVRNLFNVLQNMQDLLGRAAVKLKVTVSVMKRMELNFMMAGQRLERLQAKLSG